jgi:hypothetical protein
VAVAVEDGVMTTRPMLTQREAASACGVSRTTIRRCREAGDLPGAVQDPARGWLIPVEALLAAGFRVNAPAPPDANAGVRAAAAGGLEDSQEHQDVAALRAELERVRHAHELELAEARHGREVAEATAEHLRSQLTARCEHIEDLQQALAALMPAPERPVLPPLAPAASVPGQAYPQPSVVQARADSGAQGPVGEGRRRWWHRR